MTEGVLFEITKESLETGLRGYPVGYCNTSYVDPVKGLFYVDRPIHELAKKSEEEVIFLLNNLRESTPAELNLFKKDLQKRQKVTGELLEKIRALPKNGHPMKLFAASLLLAGMLEGTGDWREDALNVIAEAPVIVAELISHHAGWGKAKPSNPELGYMENFVHMLNIPGFHEKTKEQQQDLVEAMKLFNILHYDHGGGNLSTFVGKAVASGLEDMYGSLASAICALAGPRHGRANQDCLEFVEKILKEIGADAKTDDVEALIRKKLQNNELVFGFGHAVLRVEDPRASIFYDFVHKKYPKHPLVKISEKLRLAGIKVLSENPKISDPYPNVDAISGVALIAAGFPYPEYFPVLFGLSRLVGIARQIVYERVEARSGKGTPIVRPKYFYLGKEDVSG
jgi:citrate synthase